MMSRLGITRLYGVGMMIVLALIAYMSFTQPIRTARPRIQENLFHNVPTAQKGNPPIATGVAAGHALAYMRIPRFGRQWIWTVSEGTSQAVLAHGPGHYVGTALPGAPGNSAYAAHRAGHGDPFIDFDQLRPGDRVLLAQSGATWTYRITMTPRIIEPSEDWVIHNITPGSWLTLTTCWPKYGSAKRMYVRAKLI